MCECFDEEDETDCQPYYPMEAEPTALFQRLYAAFDTPDQGRGYGEGLAVLHVHRKWPGGGIAMVNGKEVFSFERHVE